MIPDSSLLLVARLADAAARWRAGTIEPPVFAGVYFLLWQIATHGRTFASRKSKSDTPPDAAAMLTVLQATGGSELQPWLLDCFTRYQFHGVISNVPLVLAQWLRGRWPLELRSDIPTAHDVLRAQARGTRPVTAITTYSQLHRPVLGKPNAFAFFLHDLEHAYKFFHSPALYQGQRAFFEALLEAVEQNVFLRYLDDAAFAEKFRYLMSDMNTHPQHSYQYLRAIMIEFHLHREGKRLSEPLSPQAQHETERVMRHLMNSLSAQAATVEQGQWGFAPTIPG